MSFDNRVTQLESAYFEISVSFFFFSQGLWAHRASFMHCHQCHRTERMRAIQPKKNENKGPKLPQVSSSLPCVLELVCFIHIAMQF